VLSYQAAQAIAERRLTKVLETFETEPQPVHLLHNPQAIPPLKLRALLDFAAPRLKARLADEPG